MNAYSFLVAVFLLFIVQVLFLKLCHTVPIHRQLVMTDRSWWCHDLLVPLCAP